eukprot:1188199-Prorocentrum_minimum.AAC.4
MTAVAHNTHHSAAPAGDADGDAAGDADVDADGDAPQTREVNLQLRVRGQGYSSVPKLRRS